MHKVRVGLNLIYMSERAGGIGTYTEELLPRLARKESLELTAFIGSAFPAKLKQAEWSSLVHWVKIRVHPSKRLNLAAQMILLPILAVRHRLEVIHSPANVGPFITPTAKRVVTLHDVIWLRYPEGWGNRRETRSTRILSLLTAKLSDLVLVDSEATRSDIGELTNISINKVIKAPLGTRALNKIEVLSVDELMGRFQLNEKPLALCVAQIRPYKNLARLIEAFNDPRLTGLSGQLIIVGSPTPYEKELKKMITEFKLDERVRLLGWVDDRELEGLYKMSTCFVLPSLVEGFGIPILEAMQRELPVACSNRSALSEVAGDAALLFEPEDCGAIADSIFRLLTDERLRKELAQRGRARSSQFSWDRTAEATVDAYKRLIEH